MLKSREFPGFAELSFSNYIYPQWLDIIILTDTVLPFYFVLYICGKCWDCFLSLSGPSHCDADTLDIGIFNT
jgi:hypothetical protein